MKKIVSLMFLFCLLSYSVCTATPYYVNSGGDDGHACTSSGVDNACATLGAALAKATESGDKVIVEDDCVAEDAVAPLVVADGIEILSEGSEINTVTAKNAAGATALNTNGYSVTITGVNFTGTANATANNAVTVTSHATLDKVVTITGSTITLGANSAIGSYGISTVSGGGTSQVALNISSCTLVMNSRTRCAGIMFNIPGIATIESNSISLDAAVNRQYGVKIEAGSANISKNYFSLTAPVTTAVDISRAVTVSGTATANVYNNVFNSIGTVDVTLGPIGVRALGTANVTVYGNVFFSDGVGVDVFLQVYSDTPTITAYNNTIYNAYSVFYSSTSATTSVIKNNLVHTLRGNLLIAGDVAYLPSAVTNVTYNYVHDAAGISGDATYDAAFAATNIEAGDDPALKATTGFNVLYPVAATVADVKAGGTNTGFPCLLSKTTIFHATPASQHVATVTQAAPYPIGAYGYGDFDYYVSKATGASDNNPGTQAYPWLTLTRANNEDFYDPAYAVTVHLQEDSTFAETLTVPTSGAVGKVVTYTSYDNPGGTGAKPVIDGTAGTRETVVITDKQYITLNGLDITGSKYYGIVFYGSGGAGNDHITISSCDIHNNTRFGISQWDTVGSDYTLRVNNLTIEDCTIHDNPTGGATWGGIVAGGNDMIIRRNTIYNERQAFQTTEELDYKSADGLIENNIIYSCGIATGSNGGIMMSGNHTDETDVTHDNTNFTIRYNKLYSLAGRAIDVSGQGMSVYGNVIHGVTSTTDAYAIGLEVCGSGNAVYSNTIYDTEGSAIWVSRQADGFGGYDPVAAHHIKNNICVPSGAGSLSASCIGIGNNAALTPELLDIDYNLCIKTTGVAGWFNYAGASHTIAEWQGHITSDTHSVYADPRFQSTTAGSEQLWAKAGSPAINHGVDLGDTYDDGLAYTSSWPSGVVTADQDDTRGALWTIGAYVYNDPGATTFYVDDDAADDTGAGTATGTAWKTLAMVNNGGFMPGDTVRLNDSDTWAETLTIPNSGDATDGIITINAYPGTGTKPVIDGSELLDPDDVEWSSTTKSGWINAISTTFYSVYSGSAKNNRNVIPANTITPLGTSTSTKIKVKMKGQTGAAGSHYDAVSICESTTGDDCTQDPVPILFGADPGAALVEVAQNQLTESREIDYTFDPTKRHLILVYQTVAHQDPTTGTPAAYTATLGLGRYMDGNTTDQTAVRNMTSTAYYDNEQIGVAKLDVYNTNTDIWVTAYDNGTVDSYGEDIEELYILEVDGAYCSRQPTLSDYNFFYHDTVANTLSLCYPSDPSSKAMRVGQRRRCINMNGKSYITIDGLDLTGSNYSAIHHSDVPSSNVTINNCYIHSIGGSAMGAFVGGTDWVISNNTMYHTANFHERFGNGQLGTGDAMYLLVDYTGTKYNGEGSGFLVHDNTIIDCSGSGVIIAGKDHKIYNNSFYRSATSIELCSGNTEVYNNDISYNIAPYATIASWGDQAGEQDGNIIHHNRVHDNAGGIVVDTGTGHSIYGNVIYNQSAYSTSYGIGFCRGSGSDSVVYNNTLYNNKRGIHVDNAGTTGLIVKNNIITNSSVYGIDNYGGAFAEFTNNDVWGCGVNYNTGGTDTDGRDDQTGYNGNISSDPRFQSTTAGAEKLWVKAGSPCSSAGVQIPICEILLDTKSVWPSAVTTTRMPATHIPMGAYVNPKKMLMVPEALRFKKVWD